MKKHIYIFSPSGAVRDKTAFRRGVARLKFLGHEVEVDEAALSSHQRFAGDDATRLAGIHRAAASGADVAMISRGGYGLTRLLGDIRYGAVAKAVEKGTHFLGLSDFTAFQLALLAKTGSVSWAGPSLCEGFGTDGTPDEIMEACFDDMIIGQGEGAGWRSKLIAGNPLQKRDSTTFNIKNAVLWGGNLAVLTSLIGTPYFPAIRKGILFLEDVGEHPYRIERMLTQLLHSGVLAQQRAVVLGQFTDFKLTPHDKGFNLDTVKCWLQQNLKLPVITQLPFGHVPTKVLLPVGALINLIMDDRDAFLLWSNT